jgi:hypothetical protein
MATTKKKAGTRKKTKKSARKKTSARKTGKKQATRKPSAKTKAQKKAVGKKAAKKASKKKVTRSVKRSSRPPVQNAPVVEPGPPIVQAPPVEEPVRQEEAVGVITHYFSHLGVAVVQVNAGKLRTGDSIRIKGHTTDITQTVGSLEYEHQHVDEATAGQSVGLKVVDHAREHDIVYVVK